MRFLIASVVLVAACGNHTIAGDGGDPALTGLASLEIAPADALLEATPATAATQTYTVTGHYTSGPDRDITDHVSLSVANTGVGGFASALFTSSTMQGGKTDVIAAAGGVTGSTTVTVHFTATTTGPDGGMALPTNPGASFAGTADPARAPKLAYPNDHTMLPSNLALLDVHWEPGAAANTLFQISFESATTDVSIYLRCTKPAPSQPQPINNGCVYSPDAATYHFIAESNRGGDPVTVRVRGGDDAADGFGESTTVGVQFAQSDVLGGLYYWTTTAESIMRFDFGDPTTPPTAFLTPGDVTDPNPKNGGSCVGCHAISRDGTKLVSSLDGEGAGWQIYVADLTAPRTGPIVGDQADALQFASFDPAGDRFVAVADGTDDPTRNTLWIHDGTTGARIAGESITEPNLVDHPDWSPDGSSIAYTHPTSLSNNFKQTPFQSGIDVITRSGSTWSAPTVLVAPVAGKNRFNPSFAPDSSFVIYTEATCQNGTTNDDTCDGDADPAARTWAVSVAGGAPIELANANAPGVEDVGPETSDTFPRFGPFVVPQGTGNLMWVTVASSRDAGLLVPPGSGTRHGRWLWMFAIDPAKIAAGQDGSYPGFYLPFQDLTTSNHIGQWTTKIITIQ